MGRIVHVITILQLPAAIRTGVCTLANLSLPAAGAIRKVRSSAGPAATPISGSILDKFFAPETWVVVRPKIVQRRNPCATFARLCGARWGAVANLAPDSACGSLIFNHLRIRDSPTNQGAGEFESLRARHFFP